MEDPRGCRHEPLAAASMAKTLLRREAVSMASCWRAAIWASGAGEERGREGGQRPNLDRVLMNGYDILIGAERKILRILLNITYTLRLLQKGIIVAYV